MTQPEILTVRKVAELFQVHPMTVYRWVEKRVGPPHVRVGRSIFFRRDAVDTWMRENEGVG